ncbi:DUF429 domain-containing protein [Rhodopirellula sp. MGV]|uniref:DUF429 domain-containing protein n=1 Tax=Rhodopirellula sp. MGV TaxID=2023130 RepID=UPI000B96401E|nr:DUF429 domain-containing protein [Rhodopirellula sp. MGV]OYP29925.1 DUF429 domain-containing protein [Rhodopirellula sp. MGV]PNY33719.1 DUF429 domain-containing protein [Rhodopirellula baltica]
MPIHTVMGIDYSGAAKSGRTAWAAELSRLGEGDDGDPPFRLVSLQPLGRLAANDERERVNEYLTDRIRVQKETVWGCDFPFGLPIELALGTWKNQLKLVSQFNGTAKDFGLNLVEISKDQTGALHVRRQTDQDTKTPFDCYHYRIIYQTFHGMRDVLANLIADPGVAVLPFQYNRKQAVPLRSIVLEACPSSTLKRMSLPYRNYKQSGGQSPTEAQRGVRREILAGIRHLVEISPYRRRLMLNDPGGDALDAVLAGVGAWQGYERADHHQIASHQRYPKEGYVYC